MFWMRNKENNFPIRTLIWRPNLSDTELLTIERARRSCVNMQSLSTRTQTDMALSLLCVFSIEIDIDFRKLNSFLDMFVDIIQIFGLQQCFLTD